MIPPNKNLLNPPCPPFVKGENFDGVIVEFYMVAIQKWENFYQIPRWKEMDKKAGNNFNRGYTLSILRIEILSPTQILRKLTIYG